MFKFPFMPKRKADSISNGIFLILLGVLFYTGAWWPGILFAIGLSFALRQFLTGKRSNFFITLVLLGLLSIITLAGMAFSLLFPLLFVLFGIYLILREYVYISGQRLHFRSFHANEDSKER
ncbi:hypothetical protein [Candidatus Protochlamydia phocaeensis]|uniref:hypothetical protein n=1 Tax=Candidatus Protochlamydia phocaeensis TaxID=1414722 RepID=UPI00083927EA|nr:hypothetical protein [Candidatus Protochlamydia phocaeensis]